MRRLQSWMLIILTAFVVLSLVVLGGVYLFKGFLVDFLWFKSLGYTLYFFLRLIYRYIIFFGITFLFFLIFFANFWVASRYLGTADPHAEKGSAEAKTYHKLLAMFKRGSLKVYTPLSIIIAIPVAIPFYQKWEDALLFIFAPSAQILESTYGADISFYLFRFPLYLLINKELIISFSLLFSGLLVLYYLEKRILNKSQKALPKGAKIHLALLFVFICLIKIWDYLLDRHQLLYSTSHEPVFSGPGFVEMWVDLPIIWIKIVLFTATFLSMIYYFFNRKRKIIPIVLGLVYLLVVGLSMTTFVQDTIEQYIVQPNQMIREKEYIQGSIQSTLDAYDLTNIEIRDYPVERTPAILMDYNLQESIRNVPVWDRDLLYDVYEQLQTIRPYYAFTDVDVDRYRVEDLHQQVYLSPRELDLTGLQEGGKTWPNIHLQYTHGYGLVMTPAFQRGDEPLTWFIRDIPPESDFDLEITQPDIYFGLGTYDYVIAPNDLGEIHHPKEGSGENILIDYKGTGGIKLSSYFGLPRYLFASYFHDTNILLTTKTNDDSRMIIRRNIQDIIRQLTPFLVLDEDPYLVMTSSKLYWIQDTYTISDKYPNSEMSEGKFNYIKNSVKAVVDAYDGSVSYYLIPPYDPIAMGYQKMYPGLIKSMEKMPIELRKHLRYPKYLFETQLRVYSKYHQIDPEMFYRQEDSWDFAKSIPMKSYYITLNLFDPYQHEFVLLSPMTPVNRDNLRSIAFVGCDGGNYGKMVIYSFPKGQQVYGPSQINTLIEQDTDIAEAFTLWGQAGSEVIRGRTIILPVAQSVLYIQPVYLRSTGLKIPELKRVIASQGDLVVMEPSLEEALQSLEAKLKKTWDRLKRYQGIPLEQTEAPESMREKEETPAEKSKDKEPEADVKISEEPREPEDISAEEQKDVQEPVRPEDIIDNEKITEKKAEEINKKLEDAYPMIETEEKPIPGDNQSETENNNP